MTQEVVHKDDLIAILEFATKYPDADYVTVSDSSSGIGLVSASIRTVIKDPVIIKQIVDESSW